MSTSRAIGGGSGAYVRTADHPDGDAGFIDLPCGCKQFVRRLESGRIRMGKLHHCGPEDGPLCAADPDPEPGSPNAPWRRVERALAAGQPIRPRTAEEIAASQALLARWAAL